MSTTRVTNIEIKQLDTQRLRCTVTLSDNQTRPEMIIEILRENGDHITSLTILESPDLENSFVLHLPPDLNSSSLNVNVYLKTDTLGIIDQEKTTFLLEQ